MAFVKKTWKDRIVQYANRRLLTKSGGEVEQVTVTRDEGTISEAGDQFNASNMNNLEQRVKDGFDDTKDYIDNIADYSTSEKAVGKWIDGKTIYQKVIPVNITLSNSWDNVETINGITRIISAEFLIYEGGNRSNGIRQGLFTEISTTVPYLIQIFNNTGYTIQVDYLILKYIKS